MTSKHRTERKAGKGDTLRAHRLLSLFVATRPFPGVRQASDYNNSNLSRCSKTARISSTTPLKLVTPHVHVALHASTLSAYIYMLSFQGRFLFRAPHPCVLEPTMGAPAPLCPVPAYLTTDPTRTSTPFSYPIAIAGASVQARRGGVGCSGV